MKYVFGENEEPLTDDELKNLSYVLNDGFTDIIIKGTEDAIDVTKVLAEPFWKMSIRGGKLDQIAFEEFAKKQRTTGKSEEDIIESFLQSVKGQNLDEIMMTGYHRWEATNPFCFDYKKIRIFFLARWEKSYPKSVRQKEEKFLNYPDTIKECFPSDYESYLDYILLTKPFSMAWFESHILELCLSYDANAWHLQESEYKFSAGQIFSLVKSLGLIGRLVESYRWRFTHGNDALRGKKITKAARMGGNMKKETTSSLRIKVLSKMNEFISSGHSISRAASLAASDGVGVSPEANRKLYNRAKKNK